MPDIFELVHFNDIAAPESIAYLLKFDSIHGTWSPAVEYEDGYVIISEGSRVVRVAISRQADPAKIDYAQLGVEVVMECTGAHLTRKTLQPYFDAGCAKVVVSAPVKEPSDPVLNIVVGCNEWIGHGADWKWGADGSNQLAGDQEGSGGSVVCGAGYRPVRPLPLENELLVQGLYNPSKDHIVTAASCTTNCLAPLVKVVHEQLGIEKGCITTIHCVTNTQTIIDAPNHKKSDLRRARSGLMNLAPTSTGSATAIALIFPELKGKLNGLAVRVPLTNASITDAVFTVKRKTSAEEVNALLREASDTYLKDILQVEDKPLVSMDFVNNPHSSIVDALSTQVIDGDLVKIYSWYDNEWGYSCRMVEIGKMVIEQLK